MLLNFVLDELLESPFELQEIQQSVVVSASDVETETYNLMQMRVHDANDHWQNWSKQED